MSTTSSFSKLQALLPQLFQATTIEGDRYIRFNLNAQLSALISMEDVQESLLVSAEKITPIPNMPPPVIGLMSSRDSVFCVIDLAQIMSLPPLSTYLRQYHIVVVNMSRWVGQSDSGEKTLLVGIAVNQIQGITRILSTEISTGQEISTQLLRKKFPETLKHYLRGGFQDQEEELMILDLETIFSTIRKSMVEYS